MDDASQRQQFRINAMHGHDVGVWVSGGDGFSLNPVLFMQAICPESDPRRLLVKWKSATAPPRAFKKERALPLVYSDCGRLPPWPYHLHLFAPQAPVAREVEQFTSLHDWSWAVPVIGIVLIFDQQSAQLPPALSLSRLLNRTPSEPKTPLAWAQNQQLPFVIAALSHDHSPVSVQQFRDRHALAAGVPIMPGPAPADARPRQNRSSGMFASVFERQEIAFDREYARALLQALLKLAERER